MIMLSSDTALAVLAAGGEAKKSGPLGLAVILVLCVACYFLFKSMSKHLKRVREDFPETLPPEPARPSDLPGQPPAEQQPPAARQDPPQSPQP